MATKTHSLHFTSSVASRGAALLIAIGACGGTTLIDAGDETGTGGQDPTGGSGATTGAGAGSTTSTTSSSTGVPDSLCAAACASLDDCGGATPNCVESCEQREQTPCGELHQQWLSCALGETNTMCGDGGGLICEPQLRDFLDCSGKVVGEDGCFDGPDGCSCSVFVSPGFSLVQSCDDAGNCECLFGGESVIGFCPGQSFQCDPVANCCAGLFYTGGF